MLLVFFKKMASARHRHFKSRSLMGAREGLGPGRGGSDLAENPGRKCRERISNVVGTRLNY